MRRYKGGGGTPQKQEVFSTKLPAFAQPYFDRLLQRTESESLCLGNILLTAKRTNLSGFLANKSFAEIDFMPPT